MYDIPQLEDKWKKYKKRQRRRPIVFASITILSIAALSVLSISYLNNKRIDTKKKSTEVIAKKNDINIVTEKNISKITTVKNANVQKAEDKGIVIIKHPIETRSNTNAPVNNKNTAINNNDNTIDITKVQIVNPNVKDEDIQIIGFKDKNEKNSVRNKYVHKKIDPELEQIKNVVERFKTTQETRDSLYLAKYYYKKHKYAKAENWAINTNNIDGDIEDSWIIFAKSRAKQGKRVDAIKVLQTYYNETKSQKAKDLLKKLRLGKPFR